MKENNIFTFKKYGHLNTFTGVLVMIKGLREINPYTKTLLLRTGLKPYIPKLNKLKIGVGCGGILLCLFTPATNFLIPFIIGWGLK